MTMILFNVNVGENLKKVLKVWNKINFDYCTSSYFFITKLQKKIQLLVLFYEDLIETMKIGTYKYWEGNVLNIDATSLYVISLCCLFSFVSFHISYRNYCLWFIMCTSVGIYITRNPLYGKALVICFEFHKCLAVVCNIILKIIVWLYFPLLISVVHIGFSKRRSAFCLFINSRGNTYEFYSINR